MKILRNVLLAGSVWACSAGATSLNLGPNLPFYGASAELEFDVGAQNSLGLGLGVNPGRLFYGDAFYKHFVNSSRGGPYFGARANTAVIASTLTGTAGYRADFGNSFLDVEGGLGVALFVVTHIAPAYSFNLAYGIRF